MIGVFLMKITTKLILNVAQPSWMMMKILHSKLPKTALNGTSYTFLPY